MIDLGLASDGSIPVIMEERLLQIGAWLKINGDTIYRTHALQPTQQYTTGRLPKVDYDQRFMVPYDVLAQTAKSSTGKGSIEAFFFPCPHPDNRIIEFIDHLHEHFLTPVNIRNRRYLLSQKPGYSVHIIEGPLTRFAYPTGEAGVTMHKSRLHLSAITHRDMPFLGDWGRALSECRCALPPDQRSVEWLPSVPALAMHVAISSQENGSVHH